ncbi:MAG: FAD-dependent oxidoreductase [Candidatus Nealsonbacteria bacterium]
MKPQNTAIIGAGITGLYLAWKLSAAGHKVTVFEKRPSIGKEACSGLFSERLLSFVPQSQALIQNRIESVLIHFPKKTVKVKFTKPFLLMSHAELDRLVAGLAEKAGAKIVLQSPIDVMPQGFDQIIGCDGASSATRKSLGMKDPDLRLGIRGFAALRDTSNYVETWAVKNGFIWKIPRGQETEYGVISELKSARPLFEEFLTKNNIPIERTASALIPQGLIIPRSDSVTLCGDAAGLCKPWSGGGVIWGLVASSILLKDFPDLVKYRHDVKRYFLPKIALSKIATKMAYCLGFNTPYLLPKNLEIESDFLLR